MTNRSGKPTGTEALSGIAEGLGRVFDGLKEALEKAENLSHEHDGGMEKTVRFGDENSPFSGVAGFSVRSAAAGSSRGAGNEVLKRAARRTQQKAQKPARAEAADMPAEIIELEDAFLVIAEVPGATEATLSAAGGMLSVAASGTRNHEFSIKLPETADPSDATKNLRNGILEIRLAKAQRDGE